MKKTKSFSYAKYGYLFSIPFVVAYLIFSLYPTINTVILGFTDAKGMAGLTNWHFLPADDLFKNFIAILKAPTFRKSLGNTIILWIANFIPQISLALLLTAWFTSKRNELRGQGFFKVVFYMPNIITAASIAILFKALFAYPIGPVNSLLMKLGLTDTAINFTTKVWPTRSIIAFIQFWMWYGNTMIVLVSGVLGINPDLYEAAELDGANRWQTLIRVTLPNLKPTILVMLVLSIGNLMTGGFDQIFNLSNPAVEDICEILDMYIYRITFGSVPDFGFSMAISLFRSVVNCIFLIAADRGAKKFGGSGLFG